MIRLLLPLIAFPVGLAATAASPAPARPAELAFTLSGHGGRGDLTASFSAPGRASGDHRWTSSFSAAQLAGLDLAVFHGPGAAPLRFALTRDAGALSCAGHGGSSRASGRCGFSARPEFAGALAAAAVPEPHSDEWLALFALDVKRDLLAAIRAAGYPPPDIDDLLALTAVGVDEAYIQALATAGYRPQSLDTLVELRAVGVTPEWIGAMARIGYGGLKASSLVEMRALGVTADYVESLRAAGYSRLTPGELVEMRAMGVTADFAQAVTRAFGRQPAHRLVEIKALGLVRR